MRAQVRKQKAKTARGAASGKQTPRSGPSLLRRELQGRGCDASCKWKKTSDRRMRMVLQGGLSCTAATWDCGVRSPPSASRRGHADVAAANRGRRAALTNLGMLLLEVRAHRSMGLPPFGKHKQDAEGEKKKKKKSDGLPIPSSRNNKQKQPLPDVPSHSNFRLSSHMLAPARISKWLISEFHVQS